MKYLNSINQNQGILNRGVISTRIKQGRKRALKITMHPLQNVILQTVEASGQGTYFYVVGILDIDGLNKAYLCAEGTPGEKYAANPFWVTINGRSELGDISSIVWDGALSGLYPNGDGLEFLFFDSMFGEPDLDKSWAKYMMWKNTK